MRTRTLQGQETACAEYTRRDRLTCDCGRRPIGADALRPIAPVDRPKIRLEDASAEEPGTTNADATAKDPRATACADIRILPLHEDGKVFKDALLWKGFPMQPISKRSVLSQASRAEKNKFKLRPRTFFSFEAI
jgi:hypothetical protein